MIFALLKVPFSHGTTKIIPRNLSWSKQLPPVGVQLQRDLHEFESQGWNSGSDGQSLPRSFYQPHNRPRIPLRGVNFWNLVFQFLIAELQNCPPALLHQLVICIVLKPCRHQDYVGAL